ncbi:MAG: pyridoxal phosphate-dependent aminotransferase [Tissierellia bacterium]|jgi:aspartate aminotransferase|nr:pyridoxal phosphate-dependent aminotransferase [Bacillota bacterium]NLK58299.1 pyridoxal phosphate-dependent aminotransferase [Tissierellia bacterium]
MTSKMMLTLGTQRSAIREIAAWGAKRKQEIGPENVLDFSLGNPNVPAPDEVAEAILSIVQDSSPVSYNSYTASPGADDVRGIIADNLNRRFGTDYTAKNLYLTAGAAAALCIALSALVSSDKDEVIVFAPYFPEYKVFIEARGATMKVIPARPDFSMHPEDLEEAINENTAAVLINSPNNPSGFVYDEKTIHMLSDMLRKKSREFGRPIRIVSDEPYRELAYDVKVPFLPNYYDDTLVCYSWSKSLSLPGERIGYVLVPDKVTAADEMIAAIAGSGRALGYVCAPSLFQKVIGRCIDVMPDLRIYATNREKLIAGLEKAGYEFARPDGAFYFFIKSPFPGGGQEFHERAKKEDLLVVPGASFGAPDYVRLSYCTTTEAIERALPILQKLMDEK